MSGSLSFSSLAFAFAFDRFALSLRFSVAILVLAAPFTSARTSTYCFRYCSVYHPLALPSSIYDFLIAMLHIFLFRSRFHGTLLSLLQIFFPYLFLYCPATFPSAP